MKTLQALANIKKSYQSKGKEIVLAIEKGITLAIIDDEWKEHLRELDDLKQSVQNATYEQIRILFRFYLKEIFRYRIPNMFKK